MISGQINLILALLSTDQLTRIDMEEFIKVSGEKIENVKIWECMARAENRIVSEMSMMAGGKVDCTVV